MKELVKKDQPINIIPKNFKCANKGTVSAVEDKGFSINLKYSPDGISKNAICEFYSQTQNGVLYFESSVNEIENNTIFIANPIKHRFLQRRKFTRIKFIQDLELNKGDINHKVSTLDISAGGMKFTTKSSINLDNEYKVIISLSSDQEIKCKFVPIRIEKNDEGFFTVSGRFKNLTNIDKMTLVQFCMKKNMENVNK